VPCLLLPSVFMSTAGRHAMMRHVEMDMLGSFQQSCCCKLCVDRASQTFLCIMQAGQRIRASRCRSSRCIAVLKRCSRGQRLGFAIEFLHEKPLASVVFVMCDTSMFHMASPEVP